MLKFYYPFYHKLLKTDHLLEGEANKVLLINQVINH